MKLRDPDGWAATVAANPLPSDFSRGPEDWPPYNEMTEDQRGGAYGHIVIIAAERWADEMEVRLAEHDGTVADIADSAFRAVNRELGSWGLTGFQYGAAVSILAKVWEHGEELRRWSNLNIAIGDEGERANESGGVLNPAILNLGPSEPT